MIPPFHLTTGCSAERHDRNPDTTLVAADGFVADGSFSSLSHSTATGEQARHLRLQSLHPRPVEVCHRRNRPRPARILLEARYFGPTWETSSCRGAPYGP